MPPDRRERGQSRLHSARGREDFVRRTFFSPPGLEGLGESSTEVGDDEQPGLQEDVAKLTPPPAGKGRKVLRPHELRGLPEDITVERLTEDIEEDFKTFNNANPQYIPHPDVAWYWFKDIKKGMENR